MSFAFLTGRVVLVCPRLKNKLETLESIDPLATGPKKGVASPTLRSDTITL